MAADANLGRASIAIRATLDQLDKDLAGARKQTDSAVSKIVKGAGKNFQTLGKVALGGIGVATGAVTGLSAALGKIAIDAAPVEGIQDAFAGIAESAGTSQDEMLTALKQGSAGMISQRDLMQSFNKAAGLVSEDFATQLPDAMGYLAKVSAATGEDMNFMMDSLVTGVGRMSPMILDNLGIQVSLSEATENAAEAFGIEADELTEAQKQTGMMNVVLEKLGENTASMPDVTDSATAKMARMKATIQDTKDRIGGAFLPVLSTLMDTFADLADQILPPIVSAIEDLAPVIEEIAGHIGDFVTSILEGEDPLTALKDLMLDLFPEEMAETIMNIVNGVVQFGEKVKEFLEPIAEWIGENVELQDVLIVLGAAIASVVLPALWSIITAIAPVIAVFAAAVAIVVAVRQAWETNFLGIRDNTQAVIAFVRGFIENAISFIRAFWEQNGAAILASTQQIWSTIQSVVTTVISIVQAIIAAVVGAIQTLWANHGEALTTAARNTWKMIQSVIATVINVIKHFVQAWIAAIEGDWKGFSEHLQAVWKGLWKIVSTIVSTAIQNIRTMFGSVNWGAVGRAVINGIARGISAGAGRVAEAAKGAARAAFNAAKSMLGIGSPSKLFAGVGENVMEGMAQGIESASVLPQAELSTAVNMMMRPMSGGHQAVAVPKGGGAGSYQIINHFGPDSVRSEEDIYRLAEQIEHSLELRGLHRSIY